MGNNQPSRKKPKLQRVRLPREVSSQITPYNQLPSTPHPNVQLAFQWLLIKTTNQPRNLRSAFTIKAINESVNLSDKQPHERNGSNAEGSKLQINYPYTS
jgi:hypothetical protein